MRHTKPAFPSSFDIRHSSLAVLTLANSGEDADALNLVGPALTLANAGETTADGFVRIAAYGDHPHPAGPMQRFTKEDAQGIVSRFNSTWTKIKTVLGFGDASLPVYFGHPDNGIFANARDDLDQTVYNRVTALEDREDGLYAKFKGWAEEFKTLPNGLYFSPNWNVQKGEDKAFHPTRLISLGMWTSGNLKNATLANAGEDAPATIAEPTPAVPPVNPVNDLKAKDSTILALTAELSEARAEIDRLLNDRAKADERAFAFRKALAMTLANGLFDDGRLPATQIGATVETLCAAEDADTLLGQHKALAARPLTLPNGNPVADKLPARAATTAQARQKAAGEFTAKVKAHQFYRANYERAYAETKAANRDLYQTAYGQA